MTRLLTLFVTLMSAAMLSGQTARRRNRHFRRRLFLVR